MQKKMITHEAIPLSLGAGPVILDTVVGASVGIRSGDWEGRTISESIANYGLMAGTFGGSFVTGLGLGIGYIGASLIDFFS